MDRHIYRAKKKDNGQWIQGYIVKCDGNIGHGRMFIIPEVKGILYTTNNITLGGFVEVYPDTICQCTGWHDSNTTTKIKKDVVEFVGPNTHRDLIWWNNEMSEMEAIPVDGIEFNGYDFWNSKYPKANYSTFCLMMQDPWGDFKEIKVVGNIIDNPELVGGNHEY